MQKIQTQVEKEVGLKIKREIKTPSLVSEEIRVQTEAGWWIYFNLKNDLDDQIELLNEILNATLTETEKQNLKYIDLRIENKAIYNAGSSSEEIEERKNE